MEYRCRHCNRIVPNPQGFDVERLTVTCECGALWQYRRRELPTIETDDVEIDVSEIEMIELSKGPNDY